MAPDDDLHGTLLAFEADDDCYIDRVRLLAQRPNIAGAYLAPVVEAPQIPRQQQAITVRRHFTPAGTIVYDLHQEFVARE